MSHVYKTAIQTPKTQKEKAHPSQVKNAAGGFTFALSPLSHLRRFLILGTEGGTYYADEKKHTSTNLDMVRAVLAADPKGAIETMLDVSRQNLAPKVDPTLAVLAIALCSDVQETRTLAYQAFAEVVRTGTHLFTILGLVKGQRGWGRGFKSVVQAWYLSKNGHDLAYQMLKYQQRDGWSHRDVLRLAKPKTTGAHQSAAFAWATGKPILTPNETGATADWSEVMRMIQAYEAVKAATDSKIVADIIGTERLPHECVPSEHRNAPEVWRALLPGMPYRALLRNLSTLARLEVEDVQALVLEKVSKPQGSRVHPITILLAMLAYKAGKSEKGKSTWTPSPKIVKALDGAFYAAFKEVEPTGLRISLNVDVSGSMAGSMVAGSSTLNARTAAAAMCSVLAANEPNVTVHGFTAVNASSMQKVAGGWAAPYGFNGYGGMHGGGDPTLTPLDIEGRRLDDIVKMMEALPMGGTDCSLPMRVALKEKRKVDLFVVMTDNETWAGPEHPHISLEKYRKAMGIDAKLIVMAFTATNTTIANPADKGMLDIVGLSADVPQVIRSFLVG